MSTYLAHILWILRSSPMMKAPFNTIYIAAPVSLRVIVLNNYSLNRIVLCFAFGHVILMGLFWTQKNPRGHMLDDAESDVAIMRINPPLSRESQNSCAHRTYTSHAPHSRMVILSVIAKLSLEDDDQLANEGDNYEHFPEHFFRHYSGYNLIDQLHAVVPVNAVEDKELRYPPYISPILLLEHCGKPINPPNLSVEEQEECASLLLRFQRAGWLHESVASRNFLVQRGAFPLMDPMVPSFRLIDFGRSRKYVKAKHKAEEEKAALKMLDKLGGKMTITCEL
ncbi:hypothetical protein EV363DRAFT_1430579 [Boletus edulis]|nr:hypothetical protein EV363DRAFT_1430579 [Boletus edulis]